MRRIPEIIPGETIPLNRFAEEFKAGAREVGVFALAHSRPIPHDVEQILTAPPDDLRVIQLRDKFTYIELEKIIEELAEEL